MFVFILITFFSYLWVDDIEAKEWRLTQVIKSFNGKLRNRVIWSMM